VPQIVVVEQVLVDVLPAQSSGAAIACSRVDENPPTPSDLSSIDVLLAAPRLLDDAEYDQIFPDNLGTNELRERELVANLLGFGDLRA